MRTIGKNVTKAEADDVKKLVQKCIRLLRKKEYELNLPKDAIEKALAVLDVKRTNRGDSCYGGSYNIIINLSYWQFGNKTHTEYKSFNDHPTIGEIVVSDHHDHLMMIVSHEVAHHIQYRYGPRIRRYNTNYNINL